MLVFQKSKGFHVKRFFKVFGKIRDININQGVRYEGRGGGYGGERGESAVMFAAAKMTNQVQMWSGFKE